MARVWVSLATGLVLALSPLAVGSAAASHRTRPDTPDLVPSAPALPSGSDLPSGSAQTPAPTDEFLWNSAVARNAAVQGLEDDPDTVGARCSDDSGSAVSSDVSVCVRRRIAVEAPGVAPDDSADPTASAATGGASQRLSEPTVATGTPPTSAPARSSMVVDQILDHRSEVCEGDGSDGYRVRPVYAYTGESPDPQAIQKISQALANVDATFSGSAARTGGNRQVRWVTNSGSAGCQAMLRTVRITSGAYDFDALMVDLEAQGAVQGIGYGTTKSLVWTAGNIEAVESPGDPRSNTCGLGESYWDEVPAGSALPNLNLHGTRAAIDDRCWDINGGGSVPAHELMHTLGAVQQGAPNYANSGHCSDEYDLMCYGPGMRVVCPISGEAYFDCNNDDYFNTDPDVGQYLCSHWNTSDSPYLKGWNLAQAPRAVRGLVVTGSGGVIRVTHGGTASCYGASYYRIQIPGVKTFTTTQLSSAVSAPVGTYTVTVTPHSPYGDFFGTPVSASVTVTAAPNRQPVGRMVLSLTDGRGYGMLGYAIDPDTGRSTRMRVVIPGVVNREYNWNYYWADMPAYTGWNRHEALLFLAQLPPGTHTVCFDAQDANTGGWYRLDCRTHTVK